MREMKDSGIEWIGEIPSEWRVFRVQDGFYRKDEKAKEKNPVVLSLARSGVKIRNMDNGEGQFATSYYNYNPVEKGDLLINPMDLISGDNCSISEVYGVISPAYVNLKHKKDFYSKFYHYYFKYQYWCKAFFAHGKGVSYENRWTLNNATLMKFPLVAPNLQEQCRIADFLDEKCGEINSLTEDIQEQIETLEEYKKSVITEAVTKGLDPNVEMKDSGVEWIGDVPKKWVVSTIKYVTDYLGCGIASTPDYVDEHEGVLFLSAQNIQDNKLDFAVKRYIPVSLHKKITKNIKPRKGDILQVRVGATIGKTAIIDIDEEFSIYVSLSLIRTNKKILNTYLNYYLSTDSFRKNAELFIDFAGTQGNLNVSDLKNMKIPLPSLYEQQRIADYLDSKCSEIDAIIQTKKEQLEVLAKYKKSLIYEYVTGKKEVK